MNEQEWLKLYDETKENFRWFITKYFPLRWERMERLRSENDQQGMIKIMNDVWFELPDNKFNIMVNPKGWSDFLNLIED